ncbi:hypothetical protein ACFV4F_23010 [Kitasatospora sp. NPDC059722]|uniref:hypothetical protein n=1 Tax=Kitasatospora sp. NPDC059722 TaxID=3346925 RepID=UPI0036C02687
MRKRLILGTAAGLLALAAGATTFALLSDDDRPAAHGPAWTTPAAAGRPTTAPAPGSGTSTGTPAAAPSAGPTETPAAPNGAPAGTPGPSHPIATPTFARGATRNPAKSSPAPAATPSHDSDNPVDAEPDRFAPGPGPTNQPGPTGAGQPTPVPGRTLPFPTTP